MNLPWRATSDWLEIDAMPFYWRLSGSTEPLSGISQRLPIRISVDEHFDYLKFEPTPQAWGVIEEAYHQNENIGFLNPESGQFLTYGSSVNNFFLEAIQGAAPRRIFEIGCGAGYSIIFLKEHGFDVTGIDPSEYSKGWSERLGFPLINEFFHDGLVSEKPDFVYCNDVFEHVREVACFSRVVYNCLEDGGTFCIATTNSTRSIEVGDISMFEHQHVNMFTERSIHLILREAGFSHVEVRAGSYGNTFHVVARKFKKRASAPAPDTALSCASYFERAAAKIDAFRAFYQAADTLNCYVPLRCIPYLATVADFGKSPIYDSNVSWRGKFIDGYTSPVRGIADVTWPEGGRFFVGSLTFFEEIRRTLVSHGYRAESVTCITSLT